MDKFLGVGLVKGLGLAIFVMLVIVISKTVLNKYEVKGLTDIVNMV